MKSTGKKHVDTKSASKTKHRQTKKNDTTPIIERDHSFFETHPERRTKPMIDHEPGVI